VGYRVAADTLVLLHFAFIAFVVTGGFVAWRWRWVVGLHLPAAAWGALIEFTGWICPLTPIENALRLRAGESGYTGGFIAHYVIPVVYPSGLTHEIQIALGVTVVLVNVVAYAGFVARVRSEA
jgi:hypothetical protein